MKMESKSIRLSKEQLSGLQAEAEKIAKQTRMSCDITKVIRMAVDDFISFRRRAKRKAATALYPMRIKKLLRKAWRKVTGKPPLKERTSISLRRDVALAGEARAKALSRSFSNHVAVLIQKDAASAK
jgi:hypothetical protein